MTAAAIPARAAAPWWTRTWAGALFAVILVIALWFFVRWHPVADWLTRQTGQDDEAGGKYGFWSGFGGSAPDILLITGGLAAWWHLSCHLPGCWLPGRHQLAGGTGKACRFHHPDIRGRKFTAELAAELHQLHIDRLSGKASRR